VEAAGEMRERRGGEEDKSTVGTPQVVGSGSWGSLVRGRGFGGGGEASESTGSTSLYVL
jgi:hypothetical protein